MCDCKNSSTKSLIEGSLVGAAVIGVMWLLSPGVLSLVFDTPTEAASFGDSYGALNTLFSGLAFLGVIIAIILQRQELIEQRIEIRNSRIAQEESADALSKTLEDAKIRTELESLNLIIISCRDLVESTRITNTVAEKEEHAQARERLERYRTVLSQKVDQILESNAE